MKNKLKFLITISIALLSILEAFCQNFTVTVPATFSFDDLLPPVKVGSNFQFRVSVKNNRADTVTVYINKNDMGELASWVAVDAESFVLFPAQQRDFLLTVNVPSSAADVDYALFLSFKAKDKNYNYEYFNGNTQWIIVDKSAPSTPSFDAIMTSKTIYVYSWYSIDSRSWAYTDADPTKGIAGIKEYTVELKNVAGASKTIAATGVSYYTFTNLAGNTNYTVSLKATDLVGNSSVKELNVITAPAAPTGLNFTSTTYISTTLNWAPVAGAVSYNVFEYNGSKLNSLPITATSFTINSLNPATSKTYYVEAVNGSRISDRSANATITTLALPIITGSTTVCSWGTTYTVSNLVSGYSVLWTKSTGLSLVSASGSSSVIKAISNGTAWVDATIKAPTGQSLELNAITVWAGGPQVTSQTPIAYFTSGLYNSVCNYKTFNTNMNVKGVSNVTWSRLTATPSNTTWYQTGNNLGFYFWAVGQTAVFRVSASNSCGSISQDYGFKSIDCGPNPCDAVYTMAPNPASTQTTIIINIPAPCGSTSIQADALAGDSSNKSGNLLNEPDIQSMSFDGYIAVYDNLGALKKKINYSKYGDVELDLSGLSIGIHHIEIYDGKSIQKKKILIQK